MDNLAKEVLLAKRARLSYGKWKALQPTAPVAKTETIPEGWLRCLYCGRPFKRRSPSHKYCRYECSQLGYMEELRKRKENNGKL